MKRVIYDGQDGSSISAEHLVLKAGKVSAPLPDARADGLIAQKHLKIRLASAEEIAAATPRIEWGTETPIGPKPEKDGDL